MSIIRTLLEIITFKAKPSDTPFNINATTIAFACAWLTNLWSASLQTNHPSPIFFTLIQVVTYGGMIALFLIINKKQNRIHQTLLASFGALAIINTLLFLLAYAGLGGAIFLVAIWSFAIQVYILKHSLETGFVQAFFMIIAIQITVLFFISIAFPEYLKDYLENMQKLQEQHQAQ